MNTEKMKIILYIEGQQHTCQKEDFKEVTDLLEELVTHGIKFRLVITKR